jgi:dienelactone hydrolase
MTKRSLLQIVAFAAAQGGAAAEADTECEALPPDTTVTEETYYDPAYTEDNMLCTPTATGGTCRLQGLLYVRDGAKGARAVIVNHGGANFDKHETNFLCAVRYWLRHDYVVFMPLRRGYTMNGPNIDDGADDLIASTGAFWPHVIDALDLWHDHPEFGQFPRAAMPYAEECLVHSKWGKAKDCFKSKLVHAEIEELGVAVRWLKRRMVGKSTLVDGNRVALLGHSDGAKVSILAAAHLTGIEQPQAAIALSMAEKGAFGGNTFLDDDLIHAAGTALVPIALMQPANATTITSTQILGQAAAQGRRRYLAEIFPPVILPDGEDSVHNGFFGLKDEVNRWGPVARLFLEIYPTPESAVSTDP